MNVIYWIIISLLWLVFIGEAIGQGGFESGFFFLEGYNLNLSSYYVLLDERNKNKINIHSHSKHLIVLDEHPDIDMGYL